MGSRQPRQPCYPGSDDPPHEAPKPGRTRPKLTASASSACERGAFSLAKGRHDHPVATASTRIDVGTGTEAKIPPDADAHLAQSPAVAGDRNAIAPEPGIGPYKSLLDLIRSHREHLF